RPRRAHRMVVRRGHKLTRFRFLRALREVRRACLPKHRALIEFTVGEVRPLLDCGEAVMGLEILLSNLHEVSFPAPTPATLAAELRWLAGRLMIDHGYRAALEQLPPSDRG